VSISRAGLRFAVFDVDDTLYPPDNGLWDELANRIEQYLVERMGVNPADSDTIRSKYYREHGTTLNGLMYEHPELDPLEYLAFVHDLPYEELLRPDPELNRMLADLPLRKVIFTNADRAHAENVLRHLGIQDHFEAIVDIVALDFVNKPNRAAYKTLLSTLNSPAEACVLMEDSARNIVTARGMGMTTILIRPSGTDLDGAHHHVDTVHGVGPLLKRLLNESQNDLS